ncbi:dihydrodipicolinate synthase family protein [Rhizomonospora bruguierae]|uniref:dihydrodipicolinate synthase family protein n=1 Tax=Rhizomonospora bruguierae TaxID=1581705 RepID=UPI001BCE2FD7|nr:dihydrodipicolinate synthase family protein [Micromonospora sp. NBRC 107566]
MTLTGLYVPLITPFEATGAVAVVALERLAHDVLDAGAAGLVALGTTAEAGALTAGERDTVLNVIAQICRDRGGSPLLVGADTVAAVRSLARCAGVTAALSLVPPFVRPGEAGVVAHLTTLAKASPVPLVVYHVPNRTGQPLSAEAIRRLAAVDGVAGIKYAVGGIDAEAVDLLADPPDGFAVLGGDDAFVAPLLALGAHGGILASAHVETAGFAELVHAWRTGATGRARALGHRLARLSGALFAEPNPTVIKGVLHAQGRIPSADVRLPLLPAAPGTVRSALRLLDAAPTAQPGTAVTEAA